MAKRFITFILCHNSFALVLVCCFIIATSYEQVRVWKPKFIKRS
ncbi:hypothetical protein OIU78_020121 [Salix suchowensis]|nr:hypothetical protein OIU78_020121 [Salix suchowensis]